jgi:xanthine dehydrogenase accessory factor
MPRIYDLLAAAVASDEPFALGIISAIAGSSPQKKGAKALFFADGRIAGTLGGGCLEAEIQQRARRALATGTPASFELVLDHDFGWDDGLICGGKVSGLILPKAAQASEIWAKLAQAREILTWGVKEDFTIQWVGQGVPAEPQAGRVVLSTPNSDWLYQERVSPPCALWMAGAGHIAQAVAPLAMPLDFGVTVFDDRPALANDRFFPKGTQFRVDAWEKMLDEPLPPQPVFGVIATRGHQHDALVLRNWIHRPFVSLGMLGSRRKWRVFCEQFVEEKLATAEQLARVACPVGLEIKAVSVPEIAVSIVAQLVQKRAQALNPS